MATPYIDIYSSFLIKISDFSHLKLTQEELEIELEGYMKSALVKFKRCRQDLADRDDELKQFNVDLSDDEKEIVSTLMIVEYMKPKVLTTENLKQTMSDKDFKTYSQANHIKELLTLYKECKSEANKLLTEYSYFNGDINKLE